jgi:hypothetical protein
MFKRIFKKTKPIIPMLSSMGQASFSKARLLFLIHLFQALEIKFLRVLFLKRRRSRRIAGVEKRLSHKEVN